MTTYTIASGYDTWANSFFPTSQFGSSTSLAITTGTLAFVYLPLPPDLAGQTVASATLTGQPTGGRPAATVTVRAISSSWAERLLTWNIQPSVGASQATTLALNQTPWALNVTTLIQNVASGTSWFGLRLETTADITLFSFDSGVPSWTLTITTTDTPDTPQALVPNGTVVASGAPVVTCDFKDNGGLSNDMAAMQVQVSTSTSFASPVFDSGTFATTVPVYDLAAGGFTPITAGVTRWWRVRVQDSDGNWSGYSDPASFTYQPQPTLTLLTPAAGVLWDPTSDIVASTSANLSAYRVQITSGTDRTDVRFDSGRQAANPSALTTIDVALPQEYEGSRILVDNSVYQLHVRAWDTFTNRQSTTGSPAYVDSWSTFSFNDDGAVTAPTTLVADQTNLGPSVTLTWTRAAAPDAWVILRDGKVINRVDGTTGVIVGASTYSYVDPHPVPWVDHDYTVKAISGGHQSHPSPTASITPDVKGVWLFTQSGQQVVLDGIGTDQLVVNDRRSTYKPINVRYDVDVVSGFEGLSGTFAGTFPSDVDQTQDVSAVAAILLAIKENPSQWVRLIYGMFSGRVLLRNVSITPSNLGSGVTPIMNISFGVNHVGDFGSVI